MKKMLILVISICMALSMLYAGGSSQSSAADSGGPTEFTVIFRRSGSHGDPNEMELFRMLDRDANTKVTFINIPHTGFDERKNVIINSGDLPDVFYQTAFNAAEIDTY